MKLHLAARRSVLFLVPVSLLLLGGKGTNVYDLCVDRINYRLTAQNSWHTAGGTVSAPSGSAVSFLAVPNRSSSNWPARVTIGWSGAAPIFGVPDRAQLTLGAPSSSVYTVSATSGTVPKQIALLSCGVKELRYRLDASDDFSAVSEPLYVPVNQSVEFEAVIEPDGASWPSGEPNWTGATPAAVIGQAAATFTSPVADAWDYQYVTAACGTDSVTIRVLPLAALTIVSDMRYVAKGGTLQLTARKFDGTQFVEQSRNWSIVAGGDSASFSGNAFETPTVVLAGDNVSPNAWNVRVRAEDADGDTAEATFTVVDLRLQYRLNRSGPFADVPRSDQNFFLPENTQVEFLAALTPADAPWPETGWVWTGAVAETVHPDIALQTWSARAASLADVKTVSVHCAATATTYPIVYGLGPMLYYWGAYSSDPDWIETGGFAAVPAGDCATFKLTLDPADVPWSAVPTPSWSGAVITSDPWIATDAKIVHATAFGAFPTVSGTVGTLSVETDVGDPGFAGIQYTLNGHTETANNGTTVSVPVGVPVTFTALPGVDGVELPDDLVWYESTGTGITIVGGGKQITRAWNAISTTLNGSQLIVKFGSTQASIHIVVCGIDKLEWKPEGDTYSEVTGLLSVGVGTTVYIRADLAPAGATWPFDTPAWSEPEIFTFTAADPPQPEITADLSQGAGDPADPSTWISVSASCGNSITANIVVLDQVRVVPDWPSIEVGGSLILHTRGPDSSSPDGLGDVDSDWGIVATDADGNESTVLGTEDAYIIGSPGPTVQLVGKYPASLTVRASPSDGTGPSDDAAILVVGPDRIRYRVHTDAGGGEFKELPSGSPPSMFVAVDTTLDMQLVPDPPPSPQFVWPRGMPVWSVAGGSATLSGSGATVQATCISTGDSEITARCGTTVAPPPPSGGIGIKYNATTEGDVTRMFPP